MPKAQFACQVDKARLCDNEFDKEMLAAHKFYQYSFTISHWNMLR